MIFNSIGSNYNFEFILKSLFAPNRILESTKLKNFLEQRYGGRSTLLYKGRESIKLALNIMNLPKGSRVGVTGFTCFVVNQSIVESDCKPVYIDIEKTSLNFSLTELQKHRNLKVLIIQNTLGNPSKITEIKNFCVKNNIYIIEDLAHCIGTHYEDGTEAGTQGDFTALSFSQDKVIDTISGGALVVRNKKFINQLSSLSYKKVSFKYQLKDRVYPLLTFIIRKTYPIRLGKIIHFVLKKINILSQPIASDNKIIFHTLPHWYSYLVNLQFLKLGEQLRHRREISEVYFNTILKDNMFGNLTVDLKNSSNLRFPILVDERTNVIHRLSKLGIHLSDIWYDAPISPKKLISRTGYKNDCPVAENISKNIMNLPTHINVSVSEAKDISRKINSCLNIQ